MSTYTAIARRSGDWWAISVPELRGVHTQARRLEQVEGMARDAIALMLDVEPDKIKVYVRPELPPPVSDALAARRALRDAERSAERATAAAVRALMSSGYTVRDVGAMLNLSPQRVSQIARAERAGSARRAS
jgi:predicted RNase H-like HicB family nuclease